MFTGIIEAVGNIEAITDKNGDKLFKIKATGWDFSDVQLGDSIAVNGVCLTVIELVESGFTADVSGETLAVTILKDAKVGSRVNLEKALRLSDRLGGHLVSGHVDGIGEVIERYQEARSWRFQIRPPKSLLKYIAAKGSITINGISLTVNKVENGQFDVNIVPHTLQCTTMNDLVSGSRINLEIDLLARYLEQLVNSSEDESSGVSKDLLARAGFLKS